jgi:hypothetical protein
MDATLEGSVVVVWSRFSSIIWACSEPGTGIMVVTAVVAGVEGGEREGWIWGVGDREMQNGTGNWFYFRIINCVVGETGEAGSKSFQGQRGVIGRWGGGWRVGREGYGPKEERERGEEKRRNRV